MARIRFLILLGLALLTAGDAGALPPGSPLAQEAFALCQLAEQQPDPDRVGLLTRGLALAEAAVDADRSDALAHFALFCNLGRRVQSSGFGVVGPFQVFRALRALDTALDLAPDDADVVAAKGILLLQLPPLLGGDEARAEQCLRRALSLDPTHGRARGYLADVVARHAAADDDGRIDAGEVRRIDAAAAERVR
jgi:hypothetical protein